MGILLCRSLAFETLRENFRGQVSGDAVDRHLVLAAAHDREVRVVDVIHDVLFIHRLNRLHILLGNVVDRSAAALDIALDAAQKTDIDIDVLSYQAEQQHYF